MRPALTRVESDYIGCSRPILGYGNDVAYTSSIPFRGAGVFPVVGRWGYAWDLSQLVTVVMWARRKWRAVAYWGRRTAPLSSDKELECLLRMSVVLALVPPW